LENREGQQQVLRATFPGIRDCVRELLRALAFKFHETKDMKISDEIYRLAGEYGKLKGQKAHSPQVEVDHRRTR